MGVRISISERAIYWVFYVGKRLDMMLDMMLREMGDMMDCQTVSQMDDEMDSQTGDTWMEATLETTQRIAVGEATSPQNCIL